MVEEKEKIVETEIDNSEEKEFKKSNEKNHDDEISQEKEIEKSDSSDTEANNLDNNYSMDNSNSTNNNNNNGDNNTTKETENTANTPNNINKKNITLLSQYYQNYSENIKKRLPSKAIMSFINIALLIDKTPSLFDNAVMLFSKNKNLLAETVALQGIENINNENRFKIEIFYTMIKAKIYNENIKIDFNKLSNIIKNDKLLIVYKKALKK